jgi:hypothetical protein
VVDLDRLADFRATVEVDDGAGVRIVQGAGLDRVRAVFGEDVSLVGQVAVEDVVAGVAVVVPAGRVGVVGPGVAESRAPIVVAMNPQRHQCDSGQRVGAGLQRRDVGPRDELTAALPRRADHNPIGHQHGEHCDRRQPEQRLARHVRRGHDLSKNSMRSLPVNGAASNANPLCAS